MPNAKSTIDLITELQVRAAEHRQKMAERERHNLTPEEVRVMEYFWNRERQNQRRGMPVEVIQFFERELHPPGGEHLVDSQTTRVLATLMARDYIRASANTMGLEPDVDGSNWLLHQHPPIVRWWQKLIERVPPTAQLIVASLSFVASVYGALEFVWWIIEKK